MKIIPDSIRARMILAFVLIVAIPMVLLSIFTFGRFKAEINANIRDSMVQYLNQTKNTINSILDTMIAASNAIMLDNDVREALTSGGELITPIGKTFPMEQYLVLKEKTTALQTSFLISNMTNIAIVDLNGRAFRNWSSSNSFSDDIVDTGWIQQAIDLKGSLLWIAPHDAYKGMEEHASTYISLTRLLTNPVYVQPVGILLISIREDEFYNKLFSGISANIGGDTYVINQNGQILSAYDKSLLGTKTFNEDFYSALQQGSSGSFMDTINTVKYYVNYTTVTKNGWKVVHCIDYSQLMRRVDTQRNLTILATSVLLIAFGIVVVLVTIRITKPLLEIGILMGEVAKERFDVRYQVNRRDEIGMFGERFNHMTKRLGELVEQVKLDQARKEELKTHALQAQINPHFLFNTLNMVKMTADLNQDTGVVAMLTALGKLLEMSMKTTSDLIPLHQEIEAIKSYALIQRVRYSNRFTIEYNIDDDVADTRIPKFSLQPIIENSMIHGFDTDHPFLEILVVANRKDGNVQISVSDNGAGISSERLKTVLAPKPTEQGNTFNSIGLTNVDERLRLHFGKTYGLRIESVDTGGVRTTIVVPYKENKHV